MSNSPPPTSIPLGNTTVRVSIIDTASRIGKLPLAFLMKPPLEAVKYMPALPSWSFLIEHPSGHKAIFDLGMPKNIKELAPAISEDDRFDDWDIFSPKEVIDVLEENNVPSRSINSAIWSHWHWDHIGNPSRFPPSTDLIVGPGFKQALLPAYPTKPDSPVRESDFRGRNVIEIDFEKSSQATTAAGFPAFDFFGDGSFFLLDTPGHAIGHMAALARTTSVPDTFILMGGDLSHHGGQLRPSKYMRIPASLSGTSFDRPVPQQGSCFEHVLHTLTGTTDQPFFLSAAAQVVDLEALTQTRLLAQKADADENIWVVCAHDPTVSQVAEFYPSPANDWQAKGWRSKTLWSFLGDIGDAVEPIDKIPLNLGAM